MEKKDGIDLLIIGCKHTGSPSLTFDPTGLNCRGLLNQGMVIVKSITLERHTNFKVWNVSLLT